MRKVIFWVHLTAGVVAGLVILLMCATGVLLTYEKQMVAWADRTDAALPPSPTAPRLSVDDLLQRARTIEPNANGLTLSSVPGAPALVNAGQKTLTMNAFTGEVIGESAPTLRAFFRSVTAWHRWLAVEGPGRQIARAVTGWGNFLFFIVVLGGPFIWLPRRWTLTQFKQITFFRGGLRGKARDFNWHNVIGIWSFVPLALIVLSALPMSFPWANTATYRIVGDTPPQARGGGPSGRGDGVGPRGGGAGARGEGEGGARAGRQQADGGQRAEGEPRAEGPRAEGQRAERAEGPRAERQRAERVEGQPVDGGRAEGQRAERAESQRAEGRGNGQRADSRRAEGRQADDVASAAPAAAARQAEGQDGRQQRAGGGQQAAADAPALEPLWAKAEQQVPGWRTIGARFGGNPNAPLAFTIDRGTGGQPQLRGTLTIDRATSDVVKWESFDDQSAGRRLRTFFRFAHTGEYFGIVGQTIAGLASAGGVVLVWTGLALALRRFVAWRARRAAAASAVSVSHSPAA